MTTAPVSSFFFDVAELVARADAAASGYRTAAPFPHRVFDAFLPHELAGAAAVEFDSVNKEQWDLYTDQGNTLKLATSDEELMGPLTRHLIAQFNSHAMIEFLEHLTGIEGLIPDPHLVGGGLHQLNPGGFLRVHADFNRHPRLQLDRRINLLLYLNPVWQADWGGALELWNRDMSACEASVEPLFNRVAIFNTTSVSYHGNPEPVSCPPELSRRSLAFYYYTNGRPESEREEAHSTLYQTPGEAPVTSADARSGPISPPAPGEGRARTVLRDLAPPIALRAVQRVRGRRS